MIVNVDGIVREGVQHFVVTLQWPTYTKQFPLALFKTTLAATPHLSADAMPYQKQSEAIPIGQPTHMYGAELTVGQQRSPTHSAAESVSPPRPASPMFPHNAPDSQAYRLPLLESDDDMV